jgi:hypothetical protein
MRHEQNYTVLISNKEVGMEDIAFSEDLVLQLYPHTSPDIGHVDQIAVLGPNAHGSETRHVVPRSHRGV